jgi:hypothetical protein
MKPLLVSAFAIFFAICAVSAQDTPVEYRVKAAFLFNFAKFVEWPAQAFQAQDTAFTICLAGDPFRGELDKTIQGEVWNGRRLLVKRIESGSEVRGCHLVYLSRVVAAQREILSAAANAPILTVGETDDFITAGGIIRFTENARRIRFEINPDAADKASLRVSSRLLRLADIVRPRQRAGN